MTCSEFSWSGESRLPLESVHEPLQCPTGVLCLGFKVGSRAKIVTTLVPRWLGLWLVPPIVGSSASLGLVFDRLSFSFLGIILELGSEGAYLELHLSSPETLLLGTRRLTVQCLIFVLPAPVPGRRVRS